MKPVIKVPFYSQDKERTICEICPVKCKLREGQTGLCQGRTVENGQLIATNYGETVALHLDPIEKKPLYHVAPGKVIWSAGPNGCNLTCSWCQNCEISQSKASTRYYPPETLAEHAMTNGSIGLSYTYTEPLIWYEYLLDIMPLVKQYGGLNVLVTNGYIEEKPLEKLLPLVDAANIDLKFIEPELYRKHSNADLEAIKRTIATMYNSGIHLELTHLVVTGLADNMDHFRKLVEWITDIDRDIPLHISRYSPRFKWGQPPTEPGFIRQVYEKAKEILSYVYIGNMMTSNGADTLCPGCGSVVIQRSGYSVNVSGLIGNTCGVCGRKLNFII